MNKIKKMRIAIAFCIILFNIQMSIAQQVVIKKTTCTEKSVQMLPSLYYNHTYDNYSKSKSPRMPLLFNIEKLEQNSRKNFQATGCVLRVYTRPGHSPYDMDGVQRQYSSFTIKANEYYCSTPNSTVDEGATAAEISVHLNSSVPAAFDKVGDFYVTDKSIRYRVSIQMIRPTNGPSYPAARYSNISNYVSEKSTLLGLVDEKEINHDVFLKYINGETYVEKHGGYDPKESYGYKTIERNYNIVKKGVPILVPVSRKAFLEALLEYYEIEKANFATEVAEKLKNENDKDRMKILEADKAAYNQIYQSKKARITNLLKTKSADWLSRQVATNEKARENDSKNASNGLFDFKEFESGTLLYQYNPEFIKGKDAFKPVKISVKYLYRYGKERYQWSENLIKNFEANFDFEALRKMLQ